MSQALVIVGTSGRAAAVSAVRAGYEPWVIDCVGSRDTQQIAHTLRVNAADYPGCLPGLVQQAPADAAVMLTGDMENHAEIWDAICFGRENLCSRAEAIREVRKVEVLSEKNLKRIKTPGVKSCRVKTTDQLWGRMALSLFGSLDWRKYLVKPRRGGGGYGVRHWRSGEELDASVYLQQHVEGMPIGTVFYADGWSVQFLGASEMIVGDSAFGGKDFGYVGSIGELELREKTRAAASQVAVALTQRYDLRGVFGIDWVMDFGGRLWPIEVNPRYTASVEVLERAKGVGLLKGLAKSKKTSRGLMVGKATVKAKQNGEVAADYLNELGETVVANVPEVGRKLVRGEAICTVFSQGNTRDEVYEGLREKAKAVFGGFKAG